MEASAVPELRTLVVRLLDNDKEVKTLEKIVGIAKEDSTEEETEMPTRTINDVINEILTEAQQSAEEFGCTISPEELAKATMALVLCIFKQSEPSTVDIQLREPEEKQEVKENTDGDS